MKTIKIKYTGFWENFAPENDFIYRILKKKYNVEITDEADYIICSVFGRPYHYCEYPQIRIMYAGENYIPDFNLVDYAISRYPLSLGDRHCCLPGCIDEYGHCDKLQFKNRDYHDTILEKKEYFANFIASHESENNIRGDFFKKLSKYKRVESVGSYLNNMENGETVSWIDDSKEKFQRKCKFTLCFESTAHDGFITEKITDAFLADTIPVYYGSNTVTDIFNQKAFINCSDYESFEEVIDKIIEIDNDDDKYLAMLREPIFVNNMFVKEKMEEMENFVFSIFDQEYENAYRRSRVYSPKHHENFLLNKIHSEDDCRSISSKKLTKILIKRLKQKFFSNKF